MEMVTRAAVPAGGRRRTLVLAVPTTQCILSFPWRETAAQPCF